MNTMALADVLQKGLLGKKDRILCYWDDNDLLLNWLNRQRFKADGKAVLHPSKHGPANKVLYDVVLLTAPICLERDDAALKHAVLTAFRLLRPGGRLLVFCESDTLFSAATDESQGRDPWIAHALTGENVVSCSIIRHNNIPVQTHFARKGGAYKPRFQVRLISRQEDFARACADLLNEPRIGLDVETTLKEPRILCTVQIANPTTVFLIDALPLKDLRPLKELLESESVLKIIHNKAFEEKVLGAYGIAIRNVYDTLMESRKRYKALRDGGHKLGEVCERELGIYLDKSYQASDWTRRPLSPEQLDYAAADAEVLIRLHDVFAPPPPPQNMELF